MKDLLDNKTDKELLLSMIAEIAKANNEIACAKRDIEKATSRLNFLVVLSNKMIERTKINGTETTSNKTTTTKNYG